MKVDRDLRFGTDYEKYVVLMEKKLREFKYKILALDLGMKYGFAYLKDRTLVYGYNKVTPSRYASQLSSVFEFTNHIHIIAQDMGGLDAIVFEEVHGTKGAYAMQINGMFVGAMLYSAKEHGAKVVKGFQVGAIKKWATGSGAAKKWQMIKAANEKYGTLLDPKQEDKHGDMADAIHLLSLSMQSLFSMPPLENYINERTRIGKK